MDETIRNIREISSSLRPKLLDELGFVPAVERYLKDFEFKTGIYYDFKFPENSIKFNLEESNALFRIFQEALTNVARHSKAAYVEVNFYKDNENNFNMSIQDDGIGLPENYEHKKETLGIIGMKERAHSIGGTIDIESKKNKGTILNVKLRILLNDEINEYNNSR